MYKNFNLTESERERILGMHKEHGYKKAINEQAFDIEDEQEVGEGDINEARGRKGDVAMAIWSHLNDIGYDDPKQRQVRVNFIKLLVEKFIPGNVEISVETLDKLWEQVSNGDLSGSALDEPAMDDMNEGWRDVFGEPDVKDAARSAYKSQGHSMMGKDDEQRVGEYYTVFNGEKFFSNQIEYADYQDMGELPRIENGMLIVPNPAWES